VGIGKAANTEEDLEVAVMLLQDIELLYAAIGIVAGVVPGISWIVLL
jgi:hypothetical protein